MIAFKKLAKKVKAVGGDHEYLLKEHEGGSPHNRTPTGFFALYVGEERHRHVVPTSYLSHPLFKMLLAKAYDEYGFDQKNGLVVPCSVSTFRQVLNAIKCSNGRFDLAKIFDDIP
ncbi:hypothetical protein QN277_021231 [Acacia crassicarpa]|uniref:SAUR family protein n=1 Tax=Acacia crassicarpa TaxID=499986 RepID=A0AAE1JLC5_9FABA|nr:hypothetical protein QN277_021231 [Acacia crassicarpa]